MNADLQGSLTAFADELTAALGALAGGPADAGPGTVPDERLWVATLTASGDPSARCVIVFDHQGAAALSRLAVGMDAAADVEDASVADLLRKVVTQAAAALAARPEGERLDLTLSALEPGGAPLGDPALVRAVTIAGIASPLSIALIWKPSADADAEAARLAASDDRLGNRIDVILDIDLPVVVRFGHTELPIRALSRIGPGSVIDLGRSPDDPVEVLVSNRVVARGEVVIVGGNYGVRILDVTSQSERARSVET